MRDIAKLQVVQMRPAMLYAHRWPGRLAPIALTLGLGMWLGGVAGMIGPEPLPRALLKITAGVGFMGLALWQLSQGRSLVIDRLRGWVHWSERDRGVSARESFSPMRLDSLNLRQVRFGPLRFTDLILNLDHPRITHVRLARVFDAARAERLARSFAAALEVPWHDPAGHMHVAMPGVPDPAILTKADLPPELERRDRAGLPRVCMPFAPHCTRMTLVFLLYAFMWLIWSATGLIIEAGEFGPPILWDTKATLIMASLTGATMIGIMLVLHALAGILGRAMVHKTSRGWRLTRMLFGVKWGGRPIYPRLGPDAVLRIDPPSPYAGLWVRSCDERIALGQNLSPDALDYLQRLLLGRIA